MVTSQTLMRWATVTSLELLRGSSWADGIATIAAATAQWLWRLGIDRLRGSSFSWFMAITPVDSEQLGEPRTALNDKNAQCSV